MRLRNKKRKQKKRTLNDLTPRGLVGLAAVTQWLMRRHQDPDVQGAWVQIPAGGTLWLGDGLRNQEIMEFGVLGF